MLRRTFRAMGTDIECLLERPRDGVAERALDAAQAEFARLETLLSRFRPYSELSRLNAVGEAVVGPDLLELLEAALVARDSTGGRFDPTVHDALVRAGYDRSFELLCVACEAPARPGSVAVASRCSGEVSVDRECSHVTLGPGVRLDLGGIAKGHAADRVSAALSAAGPCLVSAGGDIAVCGEPAAGVWAVAVPTGDGKITLGLGHGGIATSGTDRRVWWHGGAERHHIIDPACGRPAATDVLRVTVIAASSREAEVLATSLMLAGSLDAAADEADDGGLPCVLVSRNGRTRLAGGLA